MSHDQATRTAHKPARRTPFAPACLALVALSLAVSTATAGTVSRVNPPVCRMGVATACLPSPHTPSS